MKNDAANISKRIEMTAKLLVRVTNTVNYQGRQFEIDNILFWLKREIRSFEIQREKEKFRATKHKRPDDEVRIHSTGKDNI